jgi:hypothetical protein
MSETIKEVKLKQCSDGRIKKEYLLPYPITRDMISNLKPAGEVFIMDYLADPVFTIVHGADFNVRGMVGRRKIEIWYTVEKMPDNEREIISLFESVVNKEKALN